MFLGTLSKEYVLRISSVIEIIQILFLFIQSNNILLMNIFFISHHQMNAHTHHFYKENTVMLTGSALGNLIFF